MTGYTYALGEQAVQAFTTLSPRLRNKLLRSFDSLALHPNQLGDFHESGSAGRQYEVLLVEEIIITWWVDHAVQEVRIIRIEPVE